VPSALRGVAKGGTVVCAGIHMSDIPRFPYAILWGERRVVSVANLTRRDGREFIALAQQVPVRTRIASYPLERADEALAALRDEIRKLNDPGYFSAEALEAATRQRIVGTMLGLERASGFAHQLGFWWAVTGLDYFYGYVDTMAKQTPSDLQSYAAKYIIGKPHVIGVLLSPAMRQALKLSPSSLLDSGIRP